MYPLLLLVFLSVKTVTAPPAVSQTNESLLQTKLLIILLDGFRWDYPYQEELMGFQRLQSQGVQAQSMQPIFPTMTIPNLYCIATGLYAESHGLPFNYIHDDRKPRDFQLSPMGSDFNDSTWWEEAEPIWVTATEASRRTHVYLWPGNEVPNKGRKPTHSLPYHHAFGVDEFRGHISEMLDKFENDEADFGMVYCEEVDFTGHIFGPESKQVREVVRDIDEVIQGMLDRIDKSELKVNVIVVSDHGMTVTDSKTVSKHKMDEFIDLTDVEKVLDTGALTQIYPKTGENTFQKVYNALKSQEGYKIYKPDEIPEEYHLKHATHRLPPILVVSDIKHAVAPLWMTSVQVPFNPLPIDVLNGNHGYPTSDTTDMNGIFFAIGPDFKEGYKAPPINNTDVYNLAMHLLQLTPRPNNGSWEAVNHMLKPIDNNTLFFKSSQFTTTIRSSFSIFIFPFIAIQLFLIFALYYKVVANRV